MYPRPTARDANSTRSILVVLLLVVLCGSGAAKPNVVRAPGLGNVVECASGVINGSAPHGDEGFVSLVKMGVRTIISVDGFPPDVPKAERHGMKYVQIPVGYEGVSGENILLLTQAVRDLPRPIYIHCFHGRERSPVAAALALAGTGELNGDEALDVLRRCGTFLVVVTTQCFRYHNWVESRLGYWNSRYLRFPSCE